jgi:hypothetical protein
MAGIEDWRVGIYFSAITSELATIQAQPQSRTLRRFRGVIPKIACKQPLMSDLACWQQLTA